MKHYLHEVADVFAEVKSTELGLTSAEAETPADASSSGMIPWLAVLVLAAAGLIGIVAAKSRKKTADQK